MGKFLAILFHTKLKEKFIVTKAFTKTISKKLNLPSFSLESFCNSPNLLKSFLEFQVFIFIPPNSLYIITQFPQNFKPPITIPSLQLIPR